MVTKTNSLFTGTTNVEKAGIHTAAKVTKKYLLDYNMIFMEDKERTPVDS